MDFDGNLQQKIMDHQYFFEIGQKKFIKNKIFLDTLREMDGSFSKDLQLKLFGSLLKHSIVDNNELFTTEFSDVDLNYHDLKIIKPQILKELLGKYNRISSEFSQIIGENIENCSMIDTDGSLEIYKSLKIQYDLFRNNLEKLKNIFDEMLDLQTDKLLHVSDERMQQYKVQTKLQLARAQTINNKIKIDIFTEHNYTLNAYRRLWDDINETNMKLQQDIKDLENLKRKYQQIACKQFDELLKMFKQYQLAIRKKKQSLEYLS